MLTFSIYHNAVWASRFNVKEANGYHRLKVEVVWIAFDFAQDAARTLPNIRNFRRENRRLQ